VWLYSPAAYHFEFEFGWLRRIGGLQQPEHPGSELVGDYECAGNECHDVWIPGGLGHECARELGR
jgi:hypothetical protein